MYKHHNADFTEAFLSSWQHGDLIGVLCGRYTNGLSSSHDLIVQQCEEKVSTKCYGVALLSYEASLMAHI